MAQKYEDYTDEYGITAPLPASAGQRRLPPVGFPTGPEIGERLPDFELPSADGRRVSLHQDRGNSKAVVTFFRSAVW